jgi:hypothetical protein
MVAKSRFDRFYFSACQGSSGSCWAKSARPAPGFIRFAFGFMRLISARTALGLNGLGSPNASSPIAFAKRNEGPPSEPPGLACASQ